MSKSTTLLSVVCHCHYLGLVTPNTRDLQFESWSQLFYWNIDTNCYCYFYGKDKNNVPKYLPIPGFEPQTSGVEINHSARRTPDICFGLYRASIFVAKIEGSIFGVSTFHVFSHFRFSSLVLSFFQDERKKTWKLVFLNPGLFLFFRPFLITNWKSVDGAVGIRTCSHMMVGADDTTELWRSPNMKTCFKNNFWAKDIWQNADLI